MSKKILQIRKKFVGSLEAEAMSEEAYVDAVAEQGKAAQALETEVENAINETEGEVASLESRIEQLEIFSSFCGRPVASVEQAQLMVAFGYNAVENTDLNVFDDVLGQSKTQISSGLESDAGVTFSSESAVSTIKEMAGAAGEKLKQAGRWLWEMVMKVVNLFKDKESRVKNLKAMIEEAKKESKLKGDEKLRLTGSQAKNIGTVDEYVLFNGRIDKISSESKLPAILDEATKVIQDLGKQFSADNDKASTSDVNAKALIQSFIAIKSVYLSAFNMTAGSPDADGYTESVTNVVGKKQLKFRIKNPKDNYDAEQVVEAFGSITVSLVDSEGADAEREVEIPSVSDLEHLARELEKSVTGKVADVANIKKVADSALWSDNLWNTTLDFKNVEKLSRALLKAVNSWVVQPQVKFVTMHQSVTEDYLRFAERSAKAHVKGMGAAEEAGGEVAVV